MAIKPTKLNAEKQVVPGSQDELFTSNAGSPEWRSPSEAGISTIAYADERYEEAVDQAQGITNQALDEAKEYTDDSVEIVNENMQNYTDDAMASVVSITNSSMSLKADLVSGRVPASQLPAFAESMSVYPSAGDFPATGDGNIIYVAEDTGLPYRWAGSNYVQIQAGVQLGETSSTAYRGDRGKEAYDHTLRTDNPHQVNKAQVGLSNVDNTSDAAKPVSTATQTALNGKANTSHTHTVAQVTGLQTALDGKASTGSVTAVANDLADLGADVADKENSFAKGSIIQGSNIFISGTLTNRLVGAGDITISASAVPTPPVLSVAGKTGAVALDKNDVGLSNVDNTSDLAKPISTLTQAALNTKASTDDLAAKENAFAKGNIVQGTGMSVTGTLAQRLVGSGDVTIAVGSSVAELTSAQTLTNKRVDPRVSSTASASSLAPTIASFDQYVYTDLAANLTINAPTGTPVVGNKLLFAIKDNGTSRTLTWNAAFVPVGVTLPTATTAGKWTYVGCIYNASATRWDVIAVAGVS